MTSFTTAEAHWLEDVRWPPDPDRVVLTFAVRTAGSLKSATVAGAAESPESPFVIRKTEQRRWRY